MLRAEYKCFMGLFPEINRAWITIDNRIFLWNYLNGSDVVVYDGLDQVRNAGNEAVESFLTCSVPFDSVCVG